MHSISTTQHMDSLVLPGFAYLLFVNPRVDFVQLLRFVT
jgi:hypothetical protein